MQVASASADTARTPLLESAVQAVAGWHALVVGTIHTDHCPYDTLLPATHALCPIEHAYVRKMTNSSCPVEAPRWSLFGRAALTGTAMLKQLWACLQSDGYYREQKSQHYANGERLRDAFTDKISQCTAVHGNMALDLGVQYASIGLKLQKRADLGSFVGALQRHVLVAVLLGQAVKAIEMLRYALLQHVDSMAQKNPAASCESCIQRLFDLVHPAMASFLSDTLMDYAQGEKSPVRLLYVTLRESFSPDGTPLPGIRWRGAKSKPWYTPVPVTRLLRHLYEVAAMVYTLHTGQLNPVDMDVLNLLRMPAPERQFPTQLHTLAPLVMDLAESTWYYPTSLHSLRTAQLKLEAHIDVDCPQWQELVDCRAHPITEHQTLGLAALFAAISTIALCAPMTRIPLLQCDEGTVMHTATGSVTLDRLDSVTRSIFYSATHFMFHSDECPLCLEPMQVCDTSGAGIERSCKCDVNVHNACFEKHIIATGKCFICHESAKVKEKITQQEKLSGARSKSKV